MTSLARLGLRTTAAAAGITALGLGIAGPALAAPEPLAGTEGAAPQLLEGNEIPALPAASPELPAGDAFAFPGLPPMPELATPDYGIAAPAADPVAADPVAAEPAGPAEQDGPGVARDDVVDVETGDTSESRIEDGTRPETAQQDGAMQMLDTARGLTNNNDVSPLG